MLRKLAVVACALSGVVLPAHAQEREWLLDAAEQEVYLLFGVPNTNDVGVSFWCKMGEKEISLFSPLPASTLEVDQPADVVLMIEGKSFTLAPRQTEVDTGSVEAPLLAQQQTILEMLQNAERFSVTIAKHSSTFPLNGADFGGLLQMCETTPGQTEN